MLNSYLAQVLCVWLWFDDLCFVYRHKLSALVACTQDLRHNPVSRSEC